MIIKKFQAKTENEAVDMAKKELGPNVVIMNVKNIKKKGLFGFLKGNMVEVTVALEDEREREVPIRTSSITRPEANNNAAQIVKDQEPSMVEAAFSIPASSLTALEQLAKMQEKNIQTQEQQRKTDNRRETG